MEMMHPVNLRGGRGAHRDDVLVQHHERETPVAVARVREVVRDDPLAFPRLQPKVPRLKPVVSIGLPIALAPAVEGAGGPYTVHDGSARPTVAR